MSVRDQQIEDELKNISVTKDAFELWLQNDVTRMFMLQLEQEYIAVSQQIFPTITSTIEKIAINEIARGTNMYVLQKVLEWTPDF